MKRRLITLSTITALLFSFILTFNPWQASAASTGTDSGLPIRSSQEVIAMWKLLMNPAGDVDNPFLTKPSSSKPYAAGSLKANYIKDGVNAVNFYRFISGLPYDVTSTAQLNSRAQHGSVLLAAEGNFSHTPTQPSDMPANFYDKGYESTSSANIYGSTGYDDHIVVRSINAYMEDSDIYNLDRLGHRRWILNPPLKQVGIGLAKSADNWTYSALQVFDQSRNEKVGYSYIAYPAPGAFPIEVFKPLYAWSFSINPEEYAEPSIKEVSVSLKRLRDNKTWNLNAKSNTVTESGAYFNVENSDYGTGPAIIFRPTGVEEYKAGDRFEVTINGLKSTSGTAKPVSYTVDFISAKNDAPVTVTNPIPAAQFTDISKHWARKAIEWAAVNGIVSDIKGPFRPGDSVTEEEFLRMFTSALGKNVRAAAAGERWSTRFYDYASENGYNLQGSLKPSLRIEKISRLSVAELIASAAGQSYIGDEAIEYLLANGYSHGKTSATVEGYAGAAALTRAEAVQFIKTLVDAEYTA
ncbi:S-layer homology domain-containing protein [Cohnella sp.]|uniref:S-layer homology domain-containing protein n=1 Tax=Cohnella sp. TaxID=1883426 RepID=UPI0035625AFE